MQLPLPLTRDVLFIGGGHAHALALKMWAMDPLPGVRLTVINPNPSAPYTGMLPGYVAGHYRRDEVEIDIVRLARMAGARLITDRAVAIDRAARECVTETGRRLRYDIASIDIGVTAQAFEIDGFAEHALGVKPMDRFAAKWDRFVEDAKAGRAAPNVIIIGGGIGGAEIALAAAWRMRDLPDASVTIVEQDRLLSTQSPRLARRVERALREAGIVTREGVAIARITSDSVDLTDGQTIPGSLTIGAMGARPHAWIATTDLALNDGYVRVGPTLQTITDPDIFAVGDCAHLDHAPRPKAGVFAVRAAPVLFHNLRALASGGALRNFSPQRDFLKIMSLGDKDAIAEKWGQSISGRSIWQWKDRIDQKFMRQFTKLKPMAPPKLPSPRALGMEEALGPKPLCGGCGAKVSAGSLSDVLSGLNVLTRPDVLSLPGDDAAILAGPDGMKQVMTTDHLRAFTNDPALMARLACIHALGDIWAMGAQAQAATVSLTIPPMSLPFQNNVLEEVMTSIAQCLSQSGASLVGGHTSKGAELSIGLTVTGLCREPITNAGAKPGDVLVLTKPIGVGTVLAAEMQGAAKGEDVMSVYAQMSEPQDAASRILAKHASAMTDVTGFGLAGHLNSISQASDMCILMDLKNVPFIPAALDLAKAGIRSSLFEGNTQIAPHLLIPGDPRSALLFDPQTCGGLLACLPETAAAKTLEDLRQAGIEGAVIGHVEAGPAALRYSTDASKRIS